LEFSNVLCTEASTAVKEYMKRMNPCHATEAGLELFSLADGILKTNTVPVMKNARPVS
jgi:hypothetical protein